MGKLELKNIASYLPYRLKVKHTDIENELTAIVDLIYIAEDCIGFSNGCDYYFEPDLIHDYNPIIKPILRPMSDLYKEIEHNGVKFIPIVELAKIAYPYYQWVLNDNKTYAIGADKLLNDHTFEFDEGYYVFLFNRSANRINQFELYQKLFEWHFDVYGLIEEGFAIDINNIEIEK